VQLSLHTALRCDNTIHLLVFRLPTAMKINMAQVTKDFRPARSRCLHFRGKAKMRNIGKASNVMDLTGPV
jgi:hypothetical protein